MIRAGRCFYLMLLISTSFTAGASSPGEPEPKKNCDERVLGLKSDAQFLAMIEHVPIENWESSFANHVASNESQAKAFQMARAIANYKSHRSAGFVLSGPAGLGKTHLAVSIARQAFAANEKVMLLTPETAGYSFRSAPFGRETILLANDVMIFDDLNPSSDQFSFYGGLFIEAVHAAHRSGGKKVIVTSNASLREIIDGYFDLSIQAAEKIRFEERVRTLFKEQILDGDSARPTADWDQEL